MMLIKVLARELMGLCGSLISHLMSTFHDNTNANVEGIVLLICMMTLRSVKEVSGC